VIQCCLAQGHGERSFRNSEKRLRSREVPVPMQIISLHFWIGEKMKKARTMVLMALWNPKEYSPPLAIPVYKISHLLTFRPSVHTVRHEQNARCSCLRGEIETPRVCIRNRRLEVLESGYSFSQKWIVVLERKPQPLSLPKARNFAHRSFLA
jgi:hypothetical protein